MPGKSTNSVRCIAVTGPTGVGKTSLVQGLRSAATGAFQSGASEAHQSVEIDVKAIEFMGDHYAVIDTPGAIDFSADMDFALPGADLAIVVVDADPAKAVLAHPFLKELERLCVPRVLFVNKIDQAEGGARDLLEAFQPFSTAPLVARELPIWRGDKIVGFVDLALERAYVFRPGRPSERTDIPAEIAQIEADARFHMLEQLADYDDALMEQLLSDVVPPTDAVFADLRRETQEGLIAPVFFGAASQGFGLRRLLKSLRHDTPDPKIAAARLGLEGPGAYVMKITHSGQAGKIAVARALNAPLQDSAELTLSDGSRGRASALFSLRDGAMKKAPQAAEGEVVAIGKLDPVARGDLLSANAPARPRVVAPARFPVFQLAIATTDRKDDVRLSGALSKLVEEDPGLSVVHDPHSNEVLLLGQGEPHLRLVLDHLKKRFGVEVTSGRPATPYRETIRKGAAQRGRHKKQTGGHGQFADVMIEIKPLARGEGFRFVDKITGGAVPRQWIPAVEQGARDAMEKGPLGFPVVDVEVTLVDGAFHAVDSSELAFRIAGRVAMSEALPGCDPVVLDPIEKLIVYTPSWGTPKINSAVSSRNGQILGFETRADWPGWDQIEVCLSHAERQDFISELRSLTQGLATFHASFSHMAELSGRRAEEAIKRAKPAH
ncbi:MAG TPA: elongation factor G [Caulobacterales bacterium]|nr:elongation factor G [Caulobacterales bacterium]